MKRTLMVVIALFLITAIFAWAATAADPQKPAGHAGHQAAAAAQPESAAPAKTEPAPAATADQPAAHSGHGQPGASPMMEHMTAMMKMHGVPHEKMMAIHKITKEYEPKFFAIKQDLYTKRAELEAVMAQKEPDMAKAKAIAKEMAAVKLAQYELGIEMRAQIIKETGIRLPLDKMMGGHKMAAEMKGKMMGGGMMGPGQMKCPMMDKGQAEK